jgi:replicative DNA helicase
MSNIYNSLIIGIIDQQATKEAREAIETVLPEWIGFEPARIVFQGIQALHGQGRPIESFSIKTTVAMRDQEVEWFDNLMLDNLGSKVQLPRLVQMLKEMDASRKVNKIVSAFSDKQSLRSEEIAVVAQELALLGTTLDGNRYEMRSGASVLETLKAGLPLLPPDKTKNAIVFGLDGIDRTLRCGPGSLGVISAITGAGKTTIAIQMAAKTALAGRTVLLVSMEMNHEELYSKLHGHILKVDSYDILSNTVKRVYHPEVEASVGRVRTICPSSGASWLKMEALIRNLHTTESFSCVVFDYFTLIEPPDLNNRANSAQRYGEISKAAKRLAQDLGIAVILVAQFNRNAEECEEPRLKDLKETSQLEQDANWALLMWNTTGLVNGNPTVKARIAKNRGGSGGFDSQVYSLEASRKTGNFYECHTILAG